MTPMRCSRGPTPAPRRPTTPSTARPRSTGCSTSSRRKPTSTSARRWCGRSSAFWPRTWRGRSSITTARRPVGTPTSRATCTRKTASTTTGGSKRSGSTSNRGAPGSVARLGRRRRGLHRYHRVFVTAAAQRPVGEDLALGDPSESLFVDRLAIGLEHDAFARSPTPRVHGGVVALGKLVFVVVRVAFRPHVDIALRPAQGPVVAAHVLSIGIAVEHGADHEGGIDDFAKYQLLGEIIGAAESRAGRRASGQKGLHAAEQHALAERQVDGLGRQVLLQRLHGGIVAARLVADRNRHAGQLLGRPHG